MGILAIVLFGAMLLYILAAVMPALSTQPAGPQDITQLQKEMLETLEENPTVATTQRVGSFLFLGLSLVGLCLSLVGVTRRGAKKGLAVAGMVICGLCLSCVCIGFVFTMAGLAAGA